MKFPELPPPRSIRGKMVLVALLPLALTLPIVWIAAFYLIDHWVVGEAQNKVRQDLGAARAVLDNEQERIGGVVRFGTGHLALALALEGATPGTVARQMEEILQRGRLDFLTLADPAGRIVLQGGVSAAPQERFAPVPLAAQAASPGYCGPVVLSEGELRNESLGVAAAARIPRKAPPFDTESRGMLLVCSSPVADAHGALLGHLYGGVLLNGNLELIDRIKRTVYGAEDYRGTKIGSATLFLDDLRVATTVRLRGGERALGTAMSADVAAAVLGEQRPWIARARVLDEWHLTAYEPILGPGGEAIGAFYVGQLERPFTVLQWKAALALLALLLFGGALGALLARRGARRLSRPILDLEEGVRRIAAGERDLRVPAGGDDEIDALGRAFNAMSASLGEKEDALQQLNRALEHKVRERTAELEEQSRQLLRAREELARSEKLAAIGSLAAGVAHEINNPAAIIRGNAEIILALPQCPEGHREEAGEILRQTERISAITRNLLNFARRRPEAPLPVDVSAVVADVLARAPHQAPRGAVRIESDLPADLPKVAAEPEQLRQVFNNLVINALQAMQGRGHLRVTARSDGDSVLVEVADDGPGIPADSSEKIYDPFFTTRRDGTGLGLSVCYGIVQSLGGSIDVESEPDRGATFRVRLRADRGG